MDPISFMNEKSIRELIPVKEDDRLTGLKENKADLKKVAGEFESLFIQMILKEMRSSVNQEDGIFPPSTAMNIYQDMFDEQISKEMGQQGALNIAKALVEKYNQYVEKETTKTPALKPLLNVVG